MRGDIVRRAVEIGGGAFDSDAVLGWLADKVRALRTADRVGCGAAGAFTRTEETGTVEIHPSTRVPMGKGRMSLGFEPSETLTAVVQGVALVDELLDALATDDPLETAFSHALATELVQCGRAIIGNFGTWSRGQKPNLTCFVRFRPSPAINRML